MRIFHNKYYRLSKLTEEIKESEDIIRISAKTSKTQYINQVAEKLLKDKLKKITLRAFGKPINKCADIASIIRSKIPNLYLINNITTIPVHDTYFPIEKGLDIIEEDRDIPCLEEIILVNPTEEEKQHIGFQPVIPNI